MKEKTILTFIDTLKDIVASKLSIQAYSKEHGFNPQVIYQKMHQIKKNVDSTSAIYNEVVTLYNSIVSKANEQLPLMPELKEAEQYNDHIFVFRDSENKIYNYKITILPSGVVTLSREEVETLFGLYTYYGGNITARQLSKEFLRFTLPEVKKLFRAFNITKDSTWAPPHLMEELSIEELNLYRMNLKEKAAFKYADAKMERDFTAQIKKMASRINALEDRNALLSVITSNIPETKAIPIASISQPTNNVIMLHISDMHIGAKVESGALYDNPWDRKAVLERIRGIIKATLKLGSADELIINLLGDNIDGFDQLTARKDHILPQSMDNLEQCKLYMEVIHYLIDCLIQAYPKIRIYSVRGGNHDGDVAYVLNMALFAQLEKKYPNNITTKLFDTFFGHYKVKGHDYVICHGKDAKFMKKGLPLNLDDKNKVMIYDWLRANNILGVNVHIIKGDLHTENFNSSYSLDYRNVLSLFGSSDYANYNFTRNQCGVSYEMFLGDNLVRGTFNFK